VGYSYAVAPPAVGAGDGRARSRRPRPRHGGAWLEGGKVRGSRSTVDFKQEPLRTKDRLRPCLSSEDARTAAPSLEGPIPLGEELDGRRQPGRGLTLSRTRSGAGFRRGRRPPWEGDSDERGPASSLEGSWGSRCTSRENHPRAKRGPPSCTARPWGRPSNPEAAKDEPRGGSPRSPGRATGN